MNSETPKGKKSQNRMSEYHLKKIQHKLKKHLDENRFEHTEGVRYTCAALSMRYQYDLERAQVAGLLHDCAKCIPDGKKIKICKKHQIEMSRAEQESPFLLHAKVGAHIAEAKYGVKDREILSAIACHTTGKAGMTLLEKIVYIADYIEPHRNAAPNLEEIRRLAFEDIDRAMYVILRDTLSYLKAKGKPIDSMTQVAYEYYAELMKHDGSRKE